MIGPTRDLENITSAGPDEFIRNTATPTLHLVDSAGMSARDAHYGVVDPDLLVEGLDGLRIASVIVPDFESETILTIEIKPLCTPSQNDKFSRNMYPSFNDNL